MGRVTDRRPIVRINCGAISRLPDTLAVEEPLELRVNGRPLAVTMRTPGDDVDLAHGFLLTEGVITNRSDVRLAKHCTDTSFNVLDISLRPDLPPPVTDPTRNFYTSSSCGVCGKGSVDAVRLTSRFPVDKDAVTVSPTVLSRLPGLLREQQKGFARTGGLHAAGLFTAEAETVCVREDVGRHNAVDKVLGWAVREDRIPLTGHILMVSGRASFELTQKAALAGVPVLAAVSAPSTLAVDLAAEVGLTVVGFLREESMNVYTHSKRICG